MPRQTRPRMVVMSFRLPVDLRARLVAKAEREHANPTEVIRDLIADWVNQGDNEAE